MDKKDRSSSKELVKTFFLAFKSLSLYAANHPRSKEALEKLFTTLDTLLQSGRELFLAAGANTNELIINEELLSGDSLGVEEIYGRFKGFQVDGLSFAPGVTYAEMVRLIKAMASPTTLDGGKPAPVPKLLETGTEHILIKKMHYEKVEDGEEVVSEKEIGTPREEEAIIEELLKAKKKDTFASLRDFLDGKEEEAALEPPEILEGLERNVSKIIEAIMESAKQSGDLEAVLKKFVSWLAEYLAPVIVEQKRDPSKLIQKFFDSLNKEKVDDYGPDIDDVIERCADDIKVSILEETIYSKALSERRKVSVGVKILSDEGEKKRLLPKLEARISEKDLDKKEYLIFIEKVETELAKDEDVAISKRKLDRLLRIAARFDEELEHRTRVATENLRRINKQLIREKETSEGVMYHLADGLVVVDNAGKIVMMNPAAEKLLAQEKKDVVGKSLVEGLKEEHLMALAKGLQAEGEDSHITTEIELESRNEDTKRILKASSAVVENEDGKTVGMVSVLSDITREREVEEMKSNFVNLVTHELRTPVVAIQKSLELILSKATGEITEDQERFLSISKFNLGRLSNLINDLLDISKLEAGKIQLTPREFDLKVLIAEVKASLAGWANDKEITVQLLLPQDAVAVVADKERITQVLTNLVGNALKFTPKTGKVKIELSLSDSPEGKGAQVAVEDTGIGIEPKDLKRIFNKFEQVTLVSPVGTGGTGLGLPIAKELINLHGGRIWAESQKDKGSRFVFFLPKAFKGQGEAKKP